MELLFLCEKRHEYLNIMEEYKNRKYILDDSANYEVKVETVVERTIRSITE